MRVDSRWQHSSSAGEPVRSGGRSTTSVNAAAEAGVSSVPVARSAARRGRARDSLPASVRFTDRPMTSSSSQRSRTTSSVVHHRRPL